MLVARRDDKSPRCLPNPFEAVRAYDRARDLAVIITQVVPPNLTVNRITVYIPSLMSEQSIETIDREKLSESRLAHHREGPSRNFRQH